jgi:outer membrane protein assembly factor BamB
MAAPMKFSRTIHRFAIALTALVALSACDTVSGWFSGREEPPLPGKRVAILVQEQNLEADESTKDQEVLLPEPTENPNWPQAGGYPNHAMHHIKIRTNIQKAWAASIGDGNDDADRLIAQPVVQGGRIYTMDASSEIRASNAQTGSKLWTNDLTPKDDDDGHIGGGLAVDGNRLFVTTGFGEIFALDTNTGKIVWQRGVTAPMRSAPTVNAGRVFAITVTNKLYVLDAEDGRVLWNHSGIEEATGLLGGAAPAIDSGVVVVPYSSGELFALRIENGQELWSDSLAGQRRTRGTTSLSAIRGRPVIDRGVVYATSFGGVTTAINLRTGRRVWDKELASIESPWIAGDFLYMISVNSELVAINRADGRIHWVTQLPEFKNPEKKSDRIIWTGPVLASDRLIVASSTEEAYSVSPYDGRIMGKISLPDGVTIGPVVAGDTVYFLSDDAELVAYR